MLEYVIRIQVIEVARKEGIAEIEEVRTIPETVILSIDSVKSARQLGVVVTWAQRLVFKVNQLMATGGR